jgi:hypothetical protein
MDDEIYPDFGLSLLEAGRGDATLTFSRFVPSMMARMDEDVFTTMANLAMDQMYAVSVDFDRARFEELLRVVNPAVAAQLHRIFGGAFDDVTQVELPAGAVVIGVRARLGEPQTNGDETYVPFVAIELIAPTPDTTIEIT